MSAQQNQSAAQPQRGSNYIDLHSSGLGYISRVREVTVRKGGTFMAATIRAIHGEKGVKDGIQYVPYDVKAVNDETAEVLWNLQEMANNKDLLVMVQFKISDFYIDTFKYTTGDKAGETGTMLKGRLLKIRNAWVKSKGVGGDQDGWKRVYSAPDSSSLARYVELAQIQQGSNYIDLHASGLGYMSRIREVSVRNGAPFMAGMVRAMHGEKGVKDGIQYVPFDVKAVNDETAEVLWNLQEKANDKNLLVMVQFNIGSFNIETFKYTTGEKAGQTGTMLKGRLLKIRNAWVKTKGAGGEHDGWKNVYSAPAPVSESSQAPGEDENPQQQQAA